MVFPVYFPAYFPAYPISEYLQPLTEKPREPLFTGLLDDVIYMYLHRSDNSNPSPAAMETT